MSQIRAKDFGEPGLVQEIPGVNKENAVVNYSHLSRLLPQFGDGLGARNEVFLRSSVNKDDAINARTWGEAGIRRGENLVRWAFRDRDQKVTFWQRTLKHEISRLSDAYMEVSNCLRETLKIIQYLDRPISVAKDCLNLRSHIEFNEGPSDKVNIRLDEELSAMMSSQDDMKILAEKQREYQRNLQDTRNSLMTDAEGKTLNLVVSKSCQHSEILLSQPHFPEDKKVDQPLSPESPEQWEEAVAGRVQKSKELRTECAECCRKTENTIASNASKIAAAWEATNHAFAEEIQNDEYYLDKTRRQLKIATQDQTAAEQRLVSLERDHKIQRHQLEITNWRQQRLTYRPSQEHIRDSPIISLSEEESQLKDRLGFLDADLKKTEQQLKDVTELRKRLDLDLKSVLKKLFIDRDSCVGLRNSVVVDGRDGMYV